MAGATKKSERVYVAISHYELDKWTLKPRYQVIIVGDAGDDKDLVEEQGLIATCEMETPARIYNETLRKNLFVVSQSAAKRSYRAAWNAYIDAEIEEMEAQAQYRAHAGTR